MTQKETKDIQLQGKQGVVSPAEQTRPGLVFTPAVDIFETDSEITLLADLPGVVRNDLNIDLDNNELTITGEALPQEGTEEIDVIREYQTGRYFRQFSISDKIDQSKIEASLTNGELRLVLPKVEPVTPKKITVKVE